MDDATVIQTMAAAMAERGIPLPPEQVAADLTTAGTEQTSSAPTAVPALAAPAAPAHVDPIDAAVFAPPATPAGYAFDALPAGVQHSIEQEGEVRAIFHDFGVAAPVARQVDKLYAAAALKPPSESDLEATRQSTMQALHRTYGDEAPTVLAVARREFDAMVAKQPKLAQMAKQSGLVNDIYVITSLYTNARAKGRA